MMWADNPLHIMIPWSLLVAASNKAHASPAPNSMMLAESSDAVATLIAD